MKYIFSFEDLPRTSPHTDLLIKITNTTGDEIASGRYRVSSSLINTWQKIPEIKNLNEKIRTICEKEIRLALEKFTIIPGLDQDFGSLSINTTQGLGPDNYIDLINLRLNLVKNGTELNKKQVEKLREWTNRDIKSFLSITDNNGYPSNGLAIYLACLMDIWGSVINKCFGAMNTTGNVITILNLLEEKLGKEKYIFSRGDVDQKENFASSFRHNLVHNYGLRILATSSDWDHPNIDTVSTPSVINPQDNDRWHIDCVTLAEDLNTVLNDWVNTNYPQQK